MKIGFEKSFEKIIQKLGPADQAGAREALKTLQLNPDHPGIGLEKITKTIYSIRANRGCRIFLRRVAKDEFHAFDAGNHDLYRRLK